MPQAGTRRPPRGLSVPENGSWWDKLGLGMKLARGVKRDPEAYLLTVAADATVLTVTAVD